MSYMSERDIEARNRESGWDEVELYLPLFEDGVGVLAVTAHMYGGVLQYVSPRSVPRVRMGEREFSPEQWLAIARAARAGSTA